MPGIAPPPSPSPWKGEGEGGGRVPDEVHFDRDSKKKSHANISSIARLASPSTRSFSLCPEWPFTHFQ